MSGTIKQALGVEHPDTLRSMANLAAVFLKQGHLGKAEELGLAVLKARKRVLGAQNPSTLAGMANLAAIYKAQNRTQDALALLAEVFGHLKVVRGEDHPDTINTALTLLEWRGFDLRDFILHDDATKDALESNQEEQRRELAAVGADGDAVREVENPSVDSEE